MQQISPFKIRQAIKHVEQGQVIAYPTEAIYGLGCNPLDEEAVLHLLSIKKRSIEKGLILIASSLDQLKPYLQLNAEIIAKVQATWPGAVTWIIPAQPWVPQWLTGSHSSLAVRVSNHPVVKKLCEQNEGPLVSTSANTSTKPPATKAWQISDKLQSTDLFIVPGQVGNLTQATPIYDVLSQQQLR